MNDQYLSVKQVNNYIKNIFEAETMLQNICVYGEVSSYKISNNIAYFNIADESGLINCVLFNANRFAEPKQGDVVLVIGNVSYYAKGGRLSLNAYQIAPYGKGVLHEKFLELKAELEALGYFAEGLKKPLPARVKKIGVVTSQTGAVIQDIINVTTRRNKGVDIVLYPAKVQGVGAEVEIAKGIEVLNNQNVDAIIVARGGGSVEDLQPFNTRVVADAVYNSSKIVVSAVGHETDFTICDFCSDFRAPTPSAAAECLVNELSADVDAIVYCLGKIEQISMQLFKNNGNSYVNLCDRLIRVLANKTDLSLNKCSMLLNKIENFATRKLDANLNELNLLTSKLSLLDPLVPLKKGYVKVEGNGMAILSSKDIKSKQNYTLNFADGKAEVSGV